MNQNQSIMKILALSVLSLTLFAFNALFASCEKTSSNSTVGEKIDDALDQRPGEKIRDAVEELKE
jgi:hypothetical protein